MKRAIILSALVAVAIGIPAFCIAVNLTGSHKAKPAKVRADAAVLRDAVAELAEDIGRRPRTLDELVRCPDRGWDGPYVRRADNLFDPWGNPYVYDGSRGRVEIGSYGADGQPGGTGEDTGVFPKAD